MSGGRQKAAWNHTSAIMSLICNVNRSKDQRVFQPADFHPYAEKRPTARRPEVNQKAEAFDLLKQLGGGDLVQSTVRHSDSRPRPPDGLEGAEAEGRSGGPPESD